MYWLVEDEREREERWKTMRDIRKRELSEHQEIQDQGAAGEGAHRGIDRREAGSDAQLQERSLSSAHLAGFKRCDHTAHSDSLLATTILT